MAENGSKITLSGIKDIGIILGIAFSVGAGWSELTHLKADVAELRVQVVRIAERLPPKPGG